VELQLFKTTICNPSSSIADRGLEIVTRRWGGTGFPTCVVQIATTIPTRIEQSIILYRVESRERIGSAEFAARAVVAGTALACSKSRENDAHSRYGFVPV
jgi:hypothetical protein